MGFVRNIHHAAGEARYEDSYGQDWHGHLFCEECGDITEFTAKDLVDYAKKVGGKHSFASSGLSLKITGRCDSCRKKTRKA
jgi:Fe2+ or Zn2+ uptake regulation protein